MLAKSRFLLTNRLLYMYMKSSQKGLFTKNSIKSLNKSGIQNTRTTLNTCFCTSYGSTNKENSNNDNKKSNSAKRSEDDNDNKNDINAEIDKNEKSLESFLITRILHSGPMTIHEYMQHCSNNAHYGYYATKESIGIEGDFVTSPEISQIFGETIAIWIVHELNKMGKIVDFQLVELGPGKGTLMSDLLRTFANLLGPAILRNVSVHLVETSPRMIALQKQKLSESSSNSSKSHYGPSLNWHSNLSTVPSDKFSIFVAHEFFDALPVHKFVRNVAKNDEKKEILKNMNNNNKARNRHDYREILVDVDKTQSKLELVRAKSLTPALKYIENGEIRESLEISPQSGLILSDICRRITFCGGLSLTIDYGHEGGGEDSIRGFRRHKVISDILTEPGLIDITADVDFNYLKKCCDNSLSDLNVKPLVYGPVTQSQFLGAAGIRERAGRLASKADTEDNVDNMYGDDKKGNVAKEKDTKGVGNAGSLVRSALSTLVDEDKMGTRFKVMAVFPHTMKPIHDRLRPLGFD